jgi:peptide/nickel transport system substrate-binding protein
MKRLTRAIAVATVLATATAAIAQPKGTFKQAHDIGFGDSSSLDPISRGRVFQLTEKLMSRLVRVGLDGKPAGELAESWSTTADAQTWTFKLRPNVKFHNGKVMTAADVVYSISRIQDPKENSPVRATISLIDTVTAADPLTVVMKLKSPYAELPLVLTDYRIVVIPEGSGDTIKTTGIGTGPFKLEKFEPRGTSVLVANPDYFLGAPGVERIEVIGIADANARVQALLGGQIDFLPGMTRQQRQLIERSNKHKFWQVKTGNWRGIVFHTKMKPFDDARVRLAMRMAVDRPALANLVTGPDGAVVGCDTPVGPADQYRSTRTCAQDIAGAKKLLADAGFQNGIDVDLHVSTVEGVWPTIAEAFQQQVAAAGIRVKIVSVPTDGYWNQIWMKKEAVMTRWNDRPADAVFNEVYRSGTQWNESGFSDPAFDAILDNARRELDYDKRKALYIAAQNYLWEKAGTLVAYHVVDNVGTTSRVKDLDQAENFMIRWHLVKVD